MNKVKLKLAGIFIVLSQLATFFVFVILDLVGAHHTLRLTILIIDIVFSIGTIFLKVASPLFFPSNASPKQLQPNQFKPEPRAAIYLLRLILSFDEEQDNIIGDLLEEFNELPASLSACPWLYKQVLKSIPSLLYKNLKSRLASYFGERIR